MFVDADVDAAADVILESLRYDDVGGCGGSADALCRMNGCPTSSLLSTLMKILQPPTVI